jgi:dipeptidase E
MSVLDDYVLALTGAVRPKVCFLPTASGDADHYIVRFYRHFAGACEASHVSLFRRDPCGEHARRLAGAGAGRGAATGVAQGRGDVRALGGLPVLVRESLTAFHGAPRRVRGLGILPFSNCVHYTNEPERRGEYHRFVGDGMRPGYAADDGAALHFRGEALHRVVSSRPNARAYRVEPIAHEVVETPLEIAYLGERVPEPAAA